MWPILEVFDWRFFAGLVVGVALTFRYVVVGLYHPIIRELAEGTDDDKDSQNDID